MARAAPLLALSTMLLAGVASLATAATTSAAVGQISARCAERARGRAYVRVDSARLVLVCAFKTEALGGPYNHTPQLLLLGDTLFVAALGELPPGDHVMFTEVTEYPYQVVYGPLRRGSQLRITTRAPNEARRPRAILDTTIRVP